MDEAKDIRDKAAALEAYARQSKNVEMERWVAEIKLRAMMRIGELSKELDKAPSGRASVSLPTDGKSKSETLRAAGISTSAAHRAERLADHADEVEAYITKKVEQQQPVSYTEAIKAVEKAAKQAAPKTHAMNVGREYCTTEDLGELPATGCLASICFSNSITLRPAAEFPSGPSGASPLRCAVRSRPAD